MAGHEFRIKGEKRGNYERLVRANMITDSDAIDAGGSYGLGKSVYWSFSEFSTVLFSSVPFDSNEQLLVGRCDLASHYAEGGEEFEGRGTFGLLDTSEEATKANKVRAIALRGSEADEALTALRCPRDITETGTTITIVGFDDPTVTPEPGLEDTCQKLVNAVARQYWPCLIDGSLNVQVIGKRNGVKVLTSTPAVKAAEMEAAVKPFASLYEDHKTAVQRTDLSDAEPGELTRIDIEVRLPSRKDGGAGVITQATLLARRATAAELNSEEARFQMGTVALVRGAGMVVKHHLVGDKGAFEGFAVLLAGKARHDGDEEQNRALEEFTRACEPPAHPVSYTHLTLPTKRIV